MPTGVLVTNGYPMNSLNGLSTPMIINGHSLTYEDQLTSYPGSFDKNGNFISPLQNVTGFGKRDLRKLFVNNKTVNPFTGRKIKKNGPVYIKLMNFFNLKK